MNHKTEKWEYDYQFKNEKVFYSALLLDKSSSLEIPNSLASNPHLNLPESNAAQTYSWDGEVYLRQSDVGSSRTIATFHRNSQPVLREFPLSASNAPNLLELGDKVKEISETEFDGRAVYVVKIVPRQTESGYPHNLVYYDRQNLKFVANEVVDRQGDETGKYFVVYSAETVAPRGLPKSIEYISTSQKAGRKERVLRKQTWTLESFSEQVPEDSVFKPQISDEVVEIVYFDANQEVFRATTTSRGPGFEKFANAIEKFGIDSKNTQVALDELRHARPSKTLKIGYMAVLSGLLITVMVVFWIKKK